MSNAIAVDEIQERVSRRFGVEFVPHPVDHLGLTVGVRRARYTRYVDKLVSQYAFIDAVRDAVGHVYLTTDISQLGDHPEDVVHHSASARILTLS